MRVSERYELNRTQGELDFVDANVRGDTPLYIDPQAVRQLPGDWAHTCVAYMQDFFTAVLGAINESDDRTARVLLRGLREPNETHLGLSRGTKARGRALGPGSADAVWLALKASAAARSGLLVNLEDTALLVEGIGPDIVSDITTNLIRLPLVEYTQEMCSQHGIPMLPNVWVGLIWDPAKESWTNETRASLPMVSGRRLLLVPKAIVRRKMEYDAREYYGDFIIPFLESEEIRAGSSLVRVLKKRRTRYVTKKDLQAKYGADKAAIVRLTLQNSDLLSRYKQSKDTAPVRRIDAGALDGATGSLPPSYDALAGDVISVKPGPTGADAYHNAVERLLSALFSASLVMPAKEYPIHNGRKRIDIRYINAGGGFFGWVAANYPAANIFVECKNYSGDPANPELDQLAGRFSTSRGKFGILVCRRFKDKRLFMERCRDTAKDDRGFIIALDDDDLRALSAFALDGDSQLTYRLFMDRFQFLLS